MFMSVAFKGGDPHKKKKRVFLWFLFETLKKGVPTTKDKRICAMVKKTLLSEPTSEFL